MDYPLLLDHEVLELCFPKKYHYNFKLSCRDEKSVMRKRYKNLFKETKLEKKNNNQKLKWFIVVGKQTLMEV